MMKFVAIIAIPLLFLGCDNERENSGVHEYMFSISHEMYQSFYLPAFGPDAIKELLTYRTNLKIVHHYPANPISSYRGDSITVAHIALWTVESIRTTWLNGDQDAFSRYPSLNPIVVDTTFVIGNSFAIIDSVAELYNAWWTNISLTTEERLKKNPLEDTTFRWR